MTPKYSIIVPTLGQTTSYKDFLNSLCDLPNLNDAEILIVVNPPQENFQADIPEKLKEITKVFFSEKGVNRARNKGIESSHGEVLFFFDDDCIIINQSHFQEHLKLHESQPDISAWGGRYKNFSPSEIDEAYNRIQNRWLDMCFNPMNGTYFSLLGGNFSIKRTAFTELFNPDIEYGGSETDFFFRMNKKGYQFKLTEIPVGHAPNLTIKKFVTKAQLQARRHTEFVEKDLLPDFQFIPYTSQSNNPLEKMFYQFFTTKDSEIKFDVERKSFTQLIKKYYYLVCFFLENKNLFLKANKK